MAGCGACPTTNNKPSPTNHNQRAVLYAVGNTVVCKHEADAKRLCYGSDHNVSKAVTLDGTVVKSVGSRQGLDMQIHHPLF